MESSYSYIGYGLALLNFVMNWILKCMALQITDFEPSPNAVSHIGDERLLALQ